MKNIKILKSYVVKAFLILFISIFSLLCLSFSVSAKDADYDGAAAAFASALLEGKNSVDILEYNIPCDNVSFFQQYSQSQTPDVFWFPDTVRYTFFEEDGVIRELTWESEYEDFSDIVQMKKEFDKSVRYAVSVCFEAGMSDLDKVIAAHDYLTETASYKEVDEYSYTAYSIFVRKEGVCQGYSFAFQCLMDYCGIECYYVASASIDHGWNLVKLDGEYYYVDVTADDPMLTYNGVSITGGEMHEKLLCSDTDFACKATDIKLFANMPLPKCESTLYDDAYFKSVEGTMEYLDGDWYYVEPDEYINGSRKLMVMTENGEKTFMEWNKPLFSVVSHEGYLYCAVNNVVYKVSVSGEMELFCDTVGEIFGLTVSDNTLYYGVYRKKVYTLCSKGLPKNTSFIDGMNLDVSADSFFLNVYLKPFASNEKGTVKIAIDGVETSFSFDDVSSLGTVTVALSKEQLESAIEIYCICDSEERYYRTSVEKYCNSILYGDFDKETKKLIEALLSYSGIEKVELPENAFSGYKATVSDSSDEISFVSAEVIASKNISVNLKFSVLGSAEFTSKKEINTKKDGLYYVVSFDSFSLYELDKVFTVKSKGIEVKFSVLAFASSLDDEAKNYIYSAYEYGNALKDYKEKAK